MPETSIISSYSAMISKTTSYFFIEAIEDSKVLVISNNKWQKKSKFSAMKKDRQGEFGESEVGGNFLSVYHFKQ